MFCGTYILDADRRAVACADVMEWAEWMGGGDGISHRSVGLTEIGDVQVSTVFLGIDRAFDGGIPLLFETAVFTPDGGVHIHRYATWSGAADGHAEVVALLKAKIGNSHGASP